MIKRILEDTKYIFNSGTKTITFIDDIEFSHILLITNLTENKIIYNFACEDYGGELDGKVLTLNFNTSTMSDDDELSVIIYSEYTEGEALQVEYLNEIRKSTKTLDNIAKLLIVQNELIKEMF